jgi:hypothetical protein
MEDRIEDGDAIQITGERGNFEAIKFFLSTCHHGSGFKIKESNNINFRKEAFIIKNNPI